MDVHADVKELLPGYALGAVDEEDGALVQHHVSECRECAAALGEHLEVAASLALASGEVTAPAGLPQRILDAATGGEGILRSGGVARGTSRRRRTASPRTLGFAAVAAMVMVGMVDWNLSLQQRLTATSSQLAADQSVRGEIRSKAGAAVGAVSYRKRDSFGVVSFHGLTPPPSKVFELWIVDASGHADPIGTFLPETDGNKLILVPRNLRSSDQLVVTEEPPGGSRTPSAPIFTGKL